MHGGAAHQAVPVTPETSRPHVVVVFSSTLVRSSLPSTPFFPNVHSLPCPPCHALAVKQPVAGHRPKALAAGVADEVLYQARVHPEVRAHELSQSQVTALRDAIDEVCRVAVEVR